MYKEISEKIWLGVAVHACNPSTLEADMDDDGEHSMKPFRARKRLKHKRKKKKILKLKASSQADH